MNVKSRAKVGAAVLGVAALGVGVLSTPAAADYTTPPFRPLAGVGSDTTQYVLNGLGDVVLNTSGGKIVGSWNATGSATITPKDATVAATAHCGGINRPNGSSAGIDRLILDVNNTAQADCVDFARSSRGPVTAGPNLTWIPFGKDAVTYATDLGSTLPTNLSVAQLASIYKTCTFVDAGVTKTVSKALLPQAGSGTRTYWLQSIGVTETEITAAKAAGCVDDSVQEHDGIAIANGTQIMPYSVAQWIAQGKGFADVPNRRGESRLRNIAGVAPTTGSGTTLALNPNFTFARDVYNVVSSARLSDPNIQRAFVGASSQVCQNLATIKNYGFGDLAADSAPSNCGDTNTTGNR
ncbi:hypothetical protein AB0D49_03730 [Streptomyces sp. NPDC048290]|uniref:hypothetical protein n=1 Tax=Streptomyces sp. NPDC048290 TaxID=3155811 RepID=UPI003424D1A7